jgi:hypothetical protein
VHFAHLTLRLLETNFRASMDVVSALLAEDAERRRRSD